MLVVVWDLQTTNQLVGGLQTTNQLVGGSQTTNRLSQGLTSQGNRPPYLNKLEPKSHLGSLSGTWSPKVIFKQKQQN